MKKLLVVLAVLGLVLGFASCGGVEDDAEKSVYATLNGQINNISAIDIAAPVRVALLWRVDSEESNSFTVAQEMAVEASFPFSFTMDVTILPPPEVMMAMDLPDGTEVNFALAQLVVYEDLNGNGKLDLLDLEATQAIDRMLGLAKNSLIAYLQSDQPISAYGLEGQPGYNVMVFENCEEEDPFCDIDDGNPVIYPPTQPIVIELTGGEDLERYMCADIFTATSSLGVGSEEACTGDVALCGNCEPTPDASITCYSNYEYEWVIVEEPPVICGVRTFYYSYCSLNSEFETPANWPCANYEDTVSEPL